MEGPEIAADHYFNNSNIMTEYREAIDRGIDSGVRCISCQSEPDEEERFRHRTWHDKFRRYLAIRQDRFPQHTDFESLPVAEERLLMYQLVLIWKQVDADLTYFSSSVFTTYEKTGPELKAEAERRRAAARVAQQKAETKKLPNLRKRLQKFRKKLDSVSLACLKTCTADDMYVNILSI